MSQMQATIPVGTPEGGQFQVQTPQGPMMLTRQPGQAEGQTITFMLPEAPKAAEPQVVQAVAAAPVTVVGAQAQPQVIVVQGGVGADGVPVGAPPGGTWLTEQYSGTTTMIIAIVLLLLIWPATCAPFCCPCDSRRVYRAPDGRKWTPSGAMVPPSDCCGHPCGGPAY